MGVIMLYYIIDLINYYYNDYLTAFTILSQFYFCKLGQSFPLTLSINTNAFLFFLELGHSFSEQTEKGLA